MFFAHQLKPLQCGLSILASAAEIVKEFFIIFLAFCAKFCYTFLGFFCGIPQFLREVLFAVKTKFFVAVIAAVLVLCIGLSAVLLLPGAPAAQAEIISEGKRVAIVDLGEDRQFTVTNSAGGSNTVTVAGGKIAVTEADCPDHYCMHRGYCDSGREIVCLPNKLIIRFLGEQEIDA